jgi:hypothetical protein
MQKGDISNALPKRYLVHADLVRRETPEIKKALGFIPVVKKNISYDNALLSRFYLHTTRVGETLELIGTDMSSEDLEQLFDYLDRIGTNPFRYYTAYESIEHVVAELPYRPEVAGVVDLPNRMLRYGHWGMAFVDFFGGARE